MAKILKLEDIASELKLATPSTKELVKAGLNGNDNENFPKLFAKYKWSGTRNYNMALIIIALYTYCMKSKDFELKNFAYKAHKNFKTKSNSILIKLEFGNGTELKDILKRVEKKNHIITKIVKKANLNNEDKENEIVNNFIKQAGKITDWKINQNTISDLVNKFIDEATTKITEETVDIDDKLTKYLNDNKNEDRIKLIKLIKTRNDYGHNDKNLWKNVRLETKNRLLLFTINEEKLSIKDKFRLIKDLLNNKADPNIKNKNGNTALHLAVEHGYTDITKTLLKNKANPDIKNKNENTALHLAVEHGYTDITETLLAEGANPDIKNFYTRTALISAIRYKNLDIVNMLLNYKANPEISDFNGWTALHYAVHINNLQIVNALLKYKANPNAKNDIGDPPIYYAKSPEIKKLLIDYGASENSNTNESNTNFCEKFQEKLEELIKNKDSSEQGADELWKIYESFDKNDIESTLKSNNQFVKDVLGKKGLLLRQYGMNIVRKNNHDLFESKVQKLFSTLKPIQEADLFDN